MDLGLFLIDNIGDFSLQISNPKTYILFIDWTFKSRFKSIPPLPTSPDFSVGQRLCPLVPQHGRREAVAELYRV